MAEHRKPRIRHELPTAEWPTAAVANAARLFQPIELGPVCSEHRTWVPAMVPWRASNDGYVTQNVLDWYRRFAEGRPGVLVVEATGIRDIPSGPLLRIGDDRFLPGLHKLVETVRDASGGHTRLLIQIIDFLAIRRRPEPAKFFDRYLQLRDEHRGALLKRFPEHGDRLHDDETCRGLLQELGDDDLAQVLDSRELRDLQHGYRETVNDTHLPQIEELPRVLPDLFASAAQRAAQTGFDGVELHFAHAYTMASFLSRCNERKDGYGGSPEHRVRLPIEILHRVREVVASGSPKQPFCLGARILGDEAIDGGSTIEDATHYALELAAHGIDFLSVSKGGKFEDAKQPKIGDAAYPYTGKSGLECMPTVFSDERGPFGRNTHLSAAIRKALRGANYDTPVITAGGIGTFELAEQILQNEDADLIAAARQSLADPDWFLKIREGRGETVRRCIFTNYCEGLDQKHKEVTCQLWDRDFDDAPDATRSADGKRRLVAPPRTPSSAPE